MLSTSWKQELAEPLVERPRHAAPGERVGSVRGNWPSAIIRRSAGASRSRSPTGPFDRNAAYRTIPSTMTWMSSGCGSQRGMARAHGVRTSGASLAVRVGTGAQVPRASSCTFVPLSTDAPTD